MSFMRTLGTLAVGIAAAKGIEQYRKMGGMAGMQSMMSGATGQGNMTDQIAAMAEKMGVPGGAGAVRDMMGKFSGMMPAAGTDAGQAGLGGLIAAMQSSAQAGGKTYDDTLGAMIKGTPASVVVEENAKLMIRAMIQAAKADGGIDAAEKDKIVEHLADLEPEERAFVEAELNAPVDYTALARETGEAMKAQVYATSLTAIKVDSEAEIAYLQGLSTALGLSEEARNRVHAAMGLPPLPPAA